MNTRQDKGFLCQKGVLGVVQIGLQCTFGVWNTELKAPLVLYHLVPYYSLHFRIFICAEIVLMFQAGRMPLWIVTQATQMASATVILQLDPGALHPFFCNIFSRQIRCIASFIVLWSLPNTYLMFLYPNT